jgi:hypothetical protein
MNIHLYSHYAGRLFLGREEGQRKNIYIFDESTGNFDLLFQDMAFVDSNLQRWSVVSSTTSNRNYLFDKQYLTLSDFYEGQPVRSIHWSDNQEYALVVSGSFVFIIRRHAIKQPSVFSLDKFSIKSAPWLPNSNILILHINRVHFHTLVAIFVTESENAMLTAVYPDDISLRGFYFPQ